MSGRVRQPTCSTRTGHPPPHAASTKNLNLYPYMSLCPTHSVEFDSALPSGDPLAHYAHRGSLIVFVPSSHTACRHVHPVPNWSQRRARLRRRRTTAGPIRRQRQRRSPVSVGGIGPQFVSILDPRCRDCCRGQSLCVADIPEGVQESTLWHQCAEVEVLGRRSETSIRTALTPARSPPTSPTSPSSLPRSSPSSSSASERRSTPFTTTCGRADDQEQVRQGVVMRMSRGG